MDAWMADERTERPEVRNPGHERHKMEDTPFEKRLLGTKK
jgi:hypothetical protein